MTITDAAARQRILEETDRNLFVVAGAGSGKTTALVGRILTLVLRDGVRLENIAAVTFTEKAGAELRDRLRAKFEEAVRGGEDVERADAALQELDMAAIGTLHSFAARILLLHPIEAGMPPKLTPADEIGSGLAEEEEWARALVRLLEDEEIRPVLQRVLMATKVDRLADLYQALTDDWDLIESKVLQGPDLELRVPDLNPLRTAVAALRRVREQCSGEDVLAGHCAAALDWAAGLDADDDVALYETLHGAGGLYAVAKDDGTYKRVGSGGRWTALPGGIDEAKAALAEVRRLAVEASGAATTTALVLLTRWMARQVLEAAEVRRRNGELTFQDLLVVARQVLREHPDVAESLGRRYSHLLLDEFQDTDPIQIELAVRIAGGAAGAGESDWRDIQTRPGALFVVGDPKQSIYRFRRADIALYLEVRDWFAHTFGADSVVDLDTNFRSVPSVLGWVNHTFGNLISYKPGQQPEYLPLREHRAAVNPESGPAVHHLGWEQHEFPNHRNARRLRVEEAAEVAAVVERAMAEQWPIVERDVVTGSSVTRPIKKSDIAILVPARTSLPMLKVALDGRGIAYRADASSLLYASEDVVDLLLALQAVADRSDGFALVMTLRSALFGLGDDDLWQWKQAGGRFSLSRVPDEDEAEALKELPVYPAIEYLRKLSWDAPRLAPADLLDRLIRDRRVLEVAAADTNPSETADRWRRLRFLVDQARAWSQVAHGGVRSYLAWARRQASETAQVYESILPETDVDAVRVMTIHAAKGLEFPMVVLSGMTSQPRRPPRGIQFLWTRDGFAVSFSSQLQTSNFEVEAPIDEQMGEEERKRLLYVGATRACDHLVVSLHRGEGGAATSAAWLRDAVSPDPAIAHRLEAADAHDGTDATPLDVTPPPESHQQVVTRLLEAGSASRLPAAKTASGLEGDDPEAVIAIGQQDPDAGLTRPVLAKDQRDLDTASYRKGRDASAIGTAVHGVLQSVDLATHHDLDALARMQCLAEGIPHHEDFVRSLALRALNSDLVRQAAQAEHWRESLLVMTNPDGQILEGYADLIFREPDGSLRVVDYKTDLINDEADLTSREAYYQPQLRAYERMIREATGQEVAGSLLFLHGGGGEPRNH